MFSKVKRLTRQHDDDSIRSPETFWHTDILLVNWGWGRVDLHRRVLTIFFITSFFFFLSTFLVFGLFRIAFYFRLGV